MKTFFLMSFCLLFSPLKAQAQVESTSMLTLSPILTSARLVLSTRDALIISTFFTFVTGINSKGVANKEQIKDELVALSDDLERGVVRVLSEVKQPAIKELLEELSENEKYMQEINDLVTSGTKLHRMATALSLVLITD